MWGRFDRIILVGHEQTVPREGWEQHDALRPLCMAGVMRAGQRHDLRTAIDNGVGCVVMCSLTARTMSTMLCHLPDRLRDVHFVPELFPEEEFNALFAELGHASVADYLEKGPATTIESGLRALRVILRQCTLDEVRLNRSLLVFGHGVTLRIMAYLLVGDEKASQMKPQALLQWVSKYGEGMLLRRSGITPLGLL